MKKAKLIKHTHLLKADEYFCGNCKTKLSKPSKTCPSCGVTFKLTKDDLHWIDEAEVLDIFLGD